MRSNNSLAYLNVPFYKARISVSALALSLALAASSIALPAAAQDAAAPEQDPQQEKLLCSQSYELSQRLRNETQYLAAHDELLKCANPKCGDALFQECNRLYSELEMAMPSVIFQARDASNSQDLVDVSVTIDGRTLTQQLDGKPVVVDPGSHQFTFTAPNAPVVEKSIVIRAGEKFRQVTVAMDVKHAQLASPPSTAFPPPVAAPPRARRVPIASFVLGGVGALALGGFVALRLIGSSDYDTLKNGCAPDCSQSDVDNVKQKYLLSNIALGVGAAALVGAVVVYAVQPSGSSKGETALLVSPTVNGLLARAVTRF